MAQEFDIVAVFRDHAIGAFTFDFGRYLIATVIMAAIAWGVTRLPWGRTRKIQQRNASVADVRREFIASAQTCVVYFGVTIVMIWGVTNGVFQRIEGSRGLAVDLAILVGIVVGHDAYFYWAHRTMHHRRLFKFFHRHHHRSVTPTPFAAYSFAVPEAVVMAAFVPLWQLFVATPGWVLFTFLNWQIIRNVMGHSGVELFPRWWLANPLTRWINTTTHHDLHHNGSFNHNYGLYFTWWDKMMGTENPRYAETFAQVVAADRRVTADRPVGAATA